MSLCAPWANDIIQFQSTLTLAQEQTPSHADETKGDLQQWYHLQKTKIVTVYD